MTRLREEDVAGIPPGLAAYDAELLRKTGATLRTLACRAAGLSENRFKEILHGITFASVPVGSGQGVIPGFSGAVAGIVAHLGFPSFVTKDDDVAGMAEAVERGAHVLLFADDHRYVALVPERGVVVDNDGATALGFVAGLELMSGGLEGESVLVLGCGAVGKAAAAALLERGADLVLHDSLEDRALAAAREMGRDGPRRIRVEPSLEAALKSCELILEATDSGGFIHAGELRPGVRVAALGMPCALTPEAMAQHQDRILHDALEIGTATMAVRAAAAVAGTHADRHQNRLGRVEPPGDVNR